MSRYYGAVYHYDGQPFTGYVVFDRYEDGRIAYEVQYVDGEQVGWEVSYHENGRVADQTLMYGATSVAFYEYDTTGEQIDGGIVASAELYNKCARLAGIALIDEND